MIQQTIPQTEGVSDANPSENHHTCPNCGHQGLSIFYEVRNVPVHSCLMLPTQQEALDFPCDDVVLGFCEECGFITNVVFDPKWSAYAPNYEDQQSFSPTFNQFALDLANRLIEKYDLHDKDIVEIGCSKGDFLVLMCELGSNRGVGIDPSAVVGRVKSDATERITFIQDYYSEKYTDYVGDFICCRHTLEHIHPTLEFISTVRRSIGDRHTSVFFEIPDMGRVLTDLAFEDIYYEHCSYFTPGSLARLFRSCNFEVTDLYLAYGDQYLLIETQPVAEPSSKIHPQEESIEELANSVKQFAVNINRKLDDWKQRLQQMKAQNKRVVVWGSGSKCVAFLTTLGVTDQVDYIVDINPHRHGKFIPGVGKEIMSPEFLKDYKPDVVIVMNAIYCPEIQKMLDEMGVTTEVMPI
ncbi:MAG TPA: methyltransferase domain-containing protein [Oscillatoriales cyanobacterium M59_W2019_021]|nr:MAG: methyltransferase domain-containing protein [Cyanobacteria bacterium J055]HIK31803.1 methyltransferase domain-containing protein [Oscillatoriales cyanobacterium M4454_W2019_049]HIK52857.1 methyltransferase domain-containing protein [Oscillatoriales cyanobacterium M59_W2019_021]